jgi:hypothetical protein
MISTVQFATKSIAGSPTMPGEADREAFGRNRSLACDEAIARQRDHFGRQQTDEVALRKHAERGREIGADQPDEPGEATFGKPTIKGGPRPPLARHDQVRPGQPLLEGQTVRRRMFAP